MLNDARRIGHLPEVLQAQLRKLRRLLIQRANRPRLRQRRRPAVPRSLKRFHVQVRHVAPNHLAAHHVGAFSHRVPLLIVLPKVDNARAMASESPNGTRMPRSSANSSSACQ